MSRKAKTLDVRLSVGAQVHTSATNISNFAECSRVFGALAKTTCIGGTVLGVVAGKSKGGRNKKDLRVRWAWLGRDVENVLSLRSVRAGPPP
eukprot:contig_548_g29